MNLTSYIAIVSTALALGLTNATKAQVKNAINSTFGVGELLDNNLGMNRSMSGTGIALQSGRSINYLNPASFLGFRENSFILELGLYGMRSSSESRHDYQTDNDINISYGSLGAYLSKSWGVSFGIVPFSYVNYEVKTSEEVTGELTFVEKTFRGSGGLNRMYLGNSFKLFHNLAAGLNLSYLIGSITESESVPASGVVSAYEYATYRTIGTLQIDIGLQYTFHYSDWLYAIGLTYRPARTLTTIDSVVLTTNESVTTLDRSNLSPIMIPQSLGLGLSLGKGSFTAAFDFVWENWGAVVSDIHSDMRNSTRYSVGAEYSPGREPGSAKNISYRLGASYKNSYLEIDGVSINSMGVSVGVGIPFDVINFNTSMEYGEAGTMSKGLTKSKYWLFTLSISLSELWSPISFED